MLKTTMLGLALCGGAVPATAMQTADGVGAQQPAEPGVKPPPTPGMAGENAQSRWPKIWFQIDVAPEIAQQEPFSTDPATSDSTDVKWTLGLTHRLGNFLDMEAKFGPVATVDSDNDATSSSRLAGLLLLKTDPLLSNAGSHTGISDSATPSTAWNLRTFFRYQIALRYTDFFADRDGTEHTIDAGLMLQFKFPRAELNIEAAPRRLESTLAGSDFTSFRLSPRLKVPLFDGIALIAAGEAERRWYDHVDPLIGRERHDWRFQAFAGFDFAGAINNCLGLELFGEASIGARLIDIDSNVPGQDRSTLKFAGSMQVRVPLTYPIGRPQQTSRCA